MSRTRATHLWSNTVPQTESMHVNLMPKYSLDTAVIFLRSNWIAVKRVYTADAVHDNNLICYYAFLVIAKTTCSVRYILITLLVLYVIPISYPNLELFSKSN